MLQTWVESLLAHTECKARAEMLYCGGTHDQKVRLHALADCTNGKPPKRPVTPWWVLTVAQEADHSPMPPDCDVCFHLPFGKETGSGVGMEVGQRSQSEWTGCLREFELYPEKQAEGGFIYIPHCIIWIFKVFITVPYGTKLQVLIRLMRATQIAV